MEQLVEMEKKCVWTAYDVRCYCVNRNFYTRGDNDAYGKMLDFVRDNPPTARNVELVAIDIISHSSSLYSIFHDGDIDAIANEIWNDVVYTTGID